MVQGAMIAGIIAATVVVFRRRGRGRRTDQRAKLLVRSPEALRRYTDPRRGPAPDVGPGPLIGRDVVSGREVRAGWEDVAVAIAGSRMGKTTGWVVPAVLGAPGAVVATSNKRDVVDMTRGAREATGNRVWLYDPQAIAGGEPNWWWNPLDMAHDIAGARTLAGIFATATREAGAHTDAYFDPEGRELLAAMLLAAALAERPVTDVYRWLADPTNDEAVGHLRHADHALAGTGVRGVLGMPEKQRAGIFGTARQMIAFLSDPVLARWATVADDERPRFVAAEFVTGTDTLYALSMEGPGSAGPLTAALTAAVLRAAEAHAARSLRGRLVVPMVCVLDEVANVCRWKELPDLYSHYGSRGIVLLSFLQSWSQGVECWGREAMGKLWGAANLRIYGGGVSEAEFLDSLSKVLGDVDLPTRSVSDSRWGRQVSASMRKERVFDPDALAALPARRAVVLLSGARPVVVAVQPCFEGTHAPAVARSIARYGEGREKKVA
ncbi:MAG TPA: TraM recognition domain-containing protein [Acidimicrobiales bacterium]|nr:TraM recognition domain-containing protein [Acidimicrobiales bacterium]